jgi:hypothetical protein
MPNGHNEAYNREWCDERHDHLEGRLDKSELCIDRMEGRLRTLEIRLYALVTLLSIGGGTIGRLLGGWVG